MGPVAVALDRPWRSVTARAKVAWLWLDGQLQGWLRPKVEVWCLRAFVVLLFLPLLHWVPSYSTVEDERWTLDWRMEDRYKSLREAADVGAGKTASSDPAGAPKGQAPGKAASDRITVMLVDDEAARHSRLLSSLSPVPRSYLARVVDRARAQNAAVIGLDFLLDRPSATASADAELARALAACDRSKTRVVLPTVLQNYGYAGRDDDVFAQSLPVAPFSGLKGLWLGHSLLGSDVGKTEKTVRTMLLFLPVMSPGGYGSRDAPLQSLSFAGAVAWCAYGDAKLAPREAWDPVTEAQIAAAFRWRNSGGDELIDVSVPPGHDESYDVYSTAELFYAPPICPVDGKPVLSRQAAAGTVEYADTVYLLCSDRCVARFKKAARVYVRRFPALQKKPGAPKSFNQAKTLDRRVVLIGAGYRDTEDQHRTALSSPYLGIGRRMREKMFGVELQAYSVATLRNAMKSAPPAGRSPYLAPDGRSGLCAYVILGVWILITLSARQHLPAAVLWIGTTAMLIVYWYWAVELFTTHRTWIPLLRPTAILMVYTSALSWHLRAAAARRKRCALTWC